MAAGPWVLKAKRIRLVWYLKVPGSNAAFSQAEKRMAAPVPGASFNLCIEVLCGRRRQRITGGNLCCFYLDFRVHWASPENVKRKKKKRKNKIVGKDEFYKIR